MKSKDWSVIAMIVFLSTILSLIISNFAIKSIQSDIILVEKVNPITAEFKLPSKDYFNDKSINLTQEIKIGEETNTSPFKRN